MRSPLHQRVRIDDRRAGERTSGGDGVAVGADSDGDERLGVRRPDQRRVPRQRGEQAGPRVRGVVEVDGFDGEQQRHFDVVGVERLGGRPAGIGDDGGAVGALGLTKRQRPGAGGHDEQRGNTDDEGPPHTFRARLPAAQPAAGVEELPLRGSQVGVRQPALDRVVTGVLVHRGLGEAGAAVELALRTAHRIPRLRRGDEVAEDALPLDVVVEPAAQSRPDPHQRLVGDLDGLAIARHEALRHEHLDQPLVVRVDRQAAPRNAAAHRRAVAAVADEPQQQVLQQRPLFGRQPLVDRLGRLCDRTADAASRAVAGDGEGAPFAPLPRLAQRMRQQRQRARLALHLAHEEVDEARLRAAHRPGAPARRSPPAGRPRPSGRASTGCARRAGRRAGTPTPHRAGRRARQRPLAIAAA